MILPAGRAAAVRLDSAQIARDEHVGGLACVSLGETEVKENPGRKLAELIARVRVHFG